jgi:DNA-binding CsgD family transcriptional regulator
MDNFNPNIQETRDDFSGKFGTELSQKELAILAILKTYGSENKHLAALFGNSIPTIKNQLASINQRLGVPNRASAVIWITNNPQYLEGIENNQYYINAVKKINESTTIALIAMTDPRKINQSASDLTQLAGQVEIMKQYKECE